MNTITAAPFLRSTLQCMVKALWVILPAVILSNQPSVVLAQTSLGCNGEAVPTGMVSGSYTNACSMYNRIKQWVEDKNATEVNLYASLLNSGPTTDPNTEIEFRDFVRRIYWFGQSPIRKLDIGPIPARPKPISKADLALECSVVKSAEADTLFDCSLISAFVEPGDVGKSRGETLAVVSWTLPKPGAEQQDRLSSPRSNRNSEGGDLISLLNLGSDKIAIAWTLGEAWNSHAHIHDTNAALEAMSNLSKDDAEATEFAKECKGLKPQAIKDGAYQVVEEMVYLAQHLTRMQAGTTLEDVTELLPKVIGKPDFQSNSVNVFDAPREVVDAYRAGMAFSVLELRGENTCLQQRFQKAFRACPSAHDKFLLRTSQTESEALSRLSAVLAEYEVQLKLPTLECTPDSQKAFRLYAEETKRTAQKAMRTRYSERLAKSSEK